ncbi:MAG: helix-turn-helix transcriptional regulator [Pseudomonas sp.]
MSRTRDDTSAALSLPALHDWHLGLAQAFACVGEPDFPCHLAAALGRLMPIESMMISLECKGQPPQLLYQQGIPDEHRDAIINRYFSRGYLLDPFCLAVESGLAQGFYHLAEIAPDDFFNSEYYKSYYLKTGSAEDSYYIVDLGDHRKISVCLYQGLSAGRFTHEQLDLLRAVEPLVRAVIAQFARSGLQRGTLVVDPLAVAQVPQANLNQQIQAAFMSFGCDLLTEREREVAHLILRGHSVKSTARVVDISPETVRMHRKNLYAKLAIGSQAELFAQFIDCLTQGQ